LSDNVAISKAFIPIPATLWRIGHSLIVESTQFTGLNSETKKNVAKKIKISKIYMTFLLLLKNTERLLIAQSPWQ
jgi:hypothetical protein